MKLFAENFMKAGEDERVHKYKVKVKVLGQRDLLPDFVVKAIEHAENITKDYDGYFYNLAIAYGGREEILSAIKSVASDVQEGKLAVEDIDQELISSKLYTGGLPDPDLILRTSGEERISNFLLWQIAYSELYFVDVYWPGFLAGVQKDRFSKIYSFLSDEAEEIREVDLGVVLILDPQIGHSSNDSSKRFPHPTHLYHHSIFFLMSGNERPRYSNPSSFATF
jgi:undecaprenyl diphosphate synthase